MSLFGKLATPKLVSTRRQKPRDEKKPHTFQAVVGMAAAFRPTPGIPWRLEREWVVLFLGGVLVFALVAALYLDVTARAAITGREIQNLEAQIAANERANADLQTQIGTLLSNHSLVERATALGFERVGREDLQYVFVPGYYPTSAVNMVSTPPERDWIAETPEFHASLLVWFSEQMQSASAPLRQVEK